MIIDPYTWHRLTIESLTHVTEDTLAVGLKRPPAYQFRAGQYAVVRVTLPNGTQFIRQYSFSSDPNDTRLELLIQREPSGDVSSWFHDGAQVGDTLEISQPLGSFTIEPGLKRPILLIAGRIGVAPFISMLRDKRRRDVHLLYSVKNKNQICFSELLQTVPSTIITTDISPRIDALTISPLLSRSPIVYVCGSKQFVDAISTLLTANKVNPTEIHRELFTLQ